RRQRSAFSWPVNIGRLLRLICTTPLKVIQNNGVLHRPIESAGQNQKTRTNQPDPNKPLRSPPCRFHAIDHRRGEFTRSITAVPNSR
ncbi:MAG TPA: hypothetical protein VFV55_01420, partial [Usitatibacteraceae bacterium]|nr:hypothetical protein [Usitatibacteraceae bacterium]